VFLLYVIVVFQIKHGLISPKQTGNLRYNKATDTSAERCVNSDTFILMKTAKGFLKNNQSNASGGNKFEKICGFSYNGYCNLIICCLGRQISGERLVAHRFFA
jgi:hypothetical protein